MPNGCYGLAYKSNSLYDCQATWQRVVDAGYTSVMDPERLERWPVIVAFVYDPDGYLIELIQHDGPRPGE